MSARKGFIGMPPRSLHGHEDGMTSGLLDEEATLLAWRQRIDELLVANELDPDVFEYEAHLLDRPGGRHGFGEGCCDSETTEFVDFRDCLDEGICQHGTEEGQVCFLCSRLDLEALPHTPAIKVAEARRGVHGQEFAVTMPEELAEVLHLIAV